MSESKSGKIYANSEQRRTLMAIYLADNYPETSILEQVKTLRLWSNQLSQNYIFSLFQVSSELGFSLDWVRQWFMYTR